MIVKLLLLFLSIHTASSFCAHGHYPRLLQPLQQEIRISTLDPKPIRIHMDFSNLDSVTDLTDSQKDIIKKHAIAAKEFIEKIFKVIPTAEPIKVTSCENHIIPAEIQYVGIETDIIIFFFADLPYIYAEAFANACLIDSNTKRPIASVMGFSSLVNLTDDSAEYNYVLFIHEFLHALGFDYLLFDTFYERDTGLPHPQVYETVLKEGSYRTTIKTPRVVQKAREHFGCADLEGVELENIQGEPLNAHWELRQMLGDIMIGGAYIDLVVSNITLAFMEDMGYYWVDYFEKSPFIFGKDSGCIFAKSCALNKELISDTFFCTEDGKSVCSPNLLGKGVCFASMVAAEKHFNHFDGKLGGFPVSDFCPIAMEDLRYFNDSRCYKGFSDDLRETFGENSKCFMTNDEPKCLSVECFESYYKVNLLGETIRCDKEKEINVNGTLIKCAKVEYVCPDGTSCNSVSSCFLENSSGLISIFLIGLMVAIL